MKIIELQFKNINNLKGEHRISFEQIPLSTANIFAIVGPTGSGKSTILDVITLALFNRIPRFSKALSKNEIIKEASVMTHHTKKAFAAIEYEIKGQRYKSVWSIETNRNGKLNDYEMTFYNHNGALEDLKKKEVPLKNEEVIGLKYDQFIKAIILSQGEFSKFLKADKNERGLLLENLTGTNIYRKIGSKTYEKFKEVKEQLQKEKDLLGENITLNEEQRNQIEQELKSSQKIKTDIEKDLISLNKLFQIKTEKKNLLALLSAKTKEKVDIETAIKAFQAEQSKLTIHHKLSHLQGPLATFNDSVKNAEESKSNLKAYQLDLENTKKQLQLTIDEMASLTKQTVDALNFKKVMDTFESEIVNLDKDIQHLKQKGVDTRTRINNLKTDYLLTLGDIIAPDRAIKLLKEREIALNKLITNSKIDKNKTPAELKKSQTFQQEKLDNLKVIQNHVKTMETLHHSNEEEKRKLKHYEEIKNKNSPLIEKTKTILEVTNKQITLLRKQKDDAIKIAELEELRTNLQSGEACPLCGSLEHPYTKHLPAQLESQIDLQIKEAELNKQKYQTELSEYEKKVEKSITAINITLKAISDTQNQLKQERAICEQQIANIKEKLQLNSTFIAQLIERKSKQIQAETNAIDAILEGVKNNNLTLQYRELGENIIQYKQLIQQRNDKFGGTDIKSVTNKLQDDFESDNARITQLKTVIETESKSLKRDEELVISIKKELEPRIIKLGFNSLLEIKENLLDESTLDILTQKQESIKENTIRINTEIDSYNKDLIAKEKQDVDAKVSLEELGETIKGKSKILEENTKIAITNQEKLNRDNDDKIKIKKREEKIEKLNKEFGKWSLLNQMIGDATGNKFANFAQGLTLQNLLVYANRRLRNLSDRYLLSKPQDDGSLVVIDNYQGNSSRSVKTLSGGETFLISLALALSLSDMASKNVTLGCLYIDEGFGTLDLDTLEMAMSTLETLQSKSQKIVGVISHVEALKERINVQIKLNMNAQGYSTVEVTA